MNDEVIQLVQNAQSLATISHNIWTIGMLAIFICIPIEIIALGFSRQCMLHIDCPSQIGGVRSRCQDVVAICHQLISRIVTRTYCDFRLKVVGYVCAIFLLSPRFIADQANG